MVTPSSPLPSILYSLGFLVSWSSYLIVCSFSVSFAGSSSFPWPGVPRIQAWSSHYLHSFLGDTIQLLGLEYPLFVCWYLSNVYLQPRLFFWTPDFCIQLPTRYHCISHRHLKLNISETKVLILPPKICFIHHFPISVDDNSIFSVAQAKNLDIILNSSLSLILGI